MQFIKHIRDSYHKLLNLPGATNKVAQGVALGIAFDFLPVPIISIPLSYLVGRLIRVNAVAATLTVVIFKGFVPVFFTLDVLVGRFLLGAQHYGYVRIAHKTHHFWDIHTLLAIFLRLKSLGPAFLIGSVVNAAWASLLTYFLAKKFLDLQRQRQVRRETENISNK